MKKLLFILILFPILSFAQEEWEYGGETMNNEKFYFRDIEKKSYGNKITLWVKRQKTDKILKTKKGTIKKAGDYVVSKWECDCNEKTMETKISVVYDNKGNTKGTDTGPFFAEPVIPDSIGEHILSLACDKIFN